MNPKIIHVGTPVAASVSSKTSNRAQSISGNSVLFSSVDDLQDLISEREQ